MPAARAFPALAVLALLLASAIALAGAFSYRYASGAVAVGYPVLWFGDPMVPGVTVRLHRGGTAAEVEVSAQGPPRLERVGRSAIYFDTFDANPFEAGRMSALTTCTWSYDATAGAISASVNQRGPSDWGYSCIAAVNVDVSGYARSGRSIYVAFLAWRSGFVGLVTLHVASYYVNTTTRAQYEVGFRVSLRTGRTGDDVYSSIRYFSGTTWTSLASVYLGVSLTLEYNYLSQVVTLVDFGAWRIEHWNVSVLSSATPAAGQRFYPNRVGVGFWTSATATGTVYYDNLVVSVGGRPWLVNVTGVPSGWTVVLRSSAGREVARGVSSGGLASLQVWAPRVDLTGDPGFRDGLVFPSASIEVYDHLGRLVVSRTFDYVVGGDVYRLVLPTYSGPVLLVYSNTSAFRSRLVALGATCDPGTSVAIGLVTWDGRVTAVNVTVVGGVLQQAETSEIDVVQPGQWSDYWLALRIYARAELPPGSSCAIEAIFEWWVSPGVRALYPVDLSFYSG